MAIMQPVGDDAARFKATWSLQYRPDPIEDAQPKGRQGHPRNRKLPNRHKVRPELVSLTRGIAGTLHHHFTPTERKAWWSADSWRS